MWSAPPSVGTAGATHLQIGACFDQDARHILREGSQHVSIIIALPPYHIGQPVDGWASHRVGIKRSVVKWRISRFMSGAAGRI
jgi:hypothetical protein